MAIRRSRSPFKGIAESLHIKGNTAGTSNELSLSVLDERSKNAGERESSTPRLARLNKVSVFAVQTRRGRREKPTSDAPTGAEVAGYALDLSARGRAARARRRALDDPEREIRRRKSARRARRVVATVLGLAASASLVAFAFFGIWDAYQRNEENLTLLQQAMTELEAADEVVLEADALATGGLGDTADEDLDALASSADDAKTHINAAIAFAESAYESMGESADREAAVKVKSSAQARETMLDTAFSIIELERQARNASSSLSECWSLVLEADGLLKEAAALVTETTNENVRASQEKSEAARDVLENASSLIDDMREAYPAVDLSGLSAYVDKRLEAIGYAIASDEAIYIQDKATADAQNALYNQADSEAVEIARSLPSDPAELVSEAFEGETRQMKDDYMKTREAAAQSDAFIRDYLGESG